MIRTLQSADQIISNLSVGALNIEDTSIVMHIFRNNGSAKPIWQHMLK